MTDETTVAYAVDEDVETEHGTYRAYIEVDEYGGEGMNPRDNDGNVAVLVAYDRDYIRPLEGDLPSTILHALSEYHGRAVARWLRMFHGATVVMALRNGGRGDELHVSDLDWRDDQPGNLAGLAYDTPETREWLGDNPTTEQIEQAIRAEVSEYNDWATGEVYYYVVERDGDNLDSCGGYIGHQWAEESAVEALGAVIADEAEKYAVAQAEAASDAAEIADLARCELGYAPEVTA